MSTIDAGVLRTVARFLHPGKARASVAVASDPHYLNVWTVAGRTTVLGNLGDAATDPGDAGMQVHRSHWVAHSRVRRLVGTAGDAACILSNELLVPVSRRRLKAVREQYGRGLVHANPARSPVDGIDARRGKAGRASPG